MFDLSATQKSSTSNGMKRVYFVRHGESNGNAEEKVSSKDESLSTLGFAQAEECAKRLSKIDFTKLYASDFLRAQQTAEVIAGVTSHIIEIDSAFGEILPPSSLVGLGDYCEAVLTYRRDRLEKVEDFGWRPEDGENYNDVLNRIIKAKKILEGETTESIVVVSHGIYLSLFAMSILLNATQPTNLWAIAAKKLALDNTAITLFTIEDGNWQLKIWNDHAHFAE